MKLLLKMAKEAYKFKLLYFAAICSTLIVTVINLTGPSVLRSIMAIIEDDLSEELSKIYFLAVILLVLYLLRVLFRFFSSYLAHVAAWRLVADLRNRVYDKIQHMSARFFNDKQTGDLMSRTVNDTGTFEQLYAHIVPEMITNVVTISGVVILLFNINVRLALLTCIPIPLIFLGGFVFSKKVRPMFRVAQSAIGELNSKLQDNYAGVTEIQSFNQQDREAGNVAVCIDKYTDAILSALKMSNAFHPFVEFLSSAGTVIVVAAGGYFAWRYAFKVSDIVAFLLYLSLFYGPVAGIASLLENMQQAFAGAERVAQILDAESEVRDAPNAEPIKNVKGEITFENVNFSYEEVSVLKDINTTVKAGSFVALVGPTGVGKTTFTRLISRFYDPLAGAIYIDGQNIRDITLRSLRENIAPVLQDTYLFNGTVSENIAYARVDAKRGEIIDAAKAAYIHDEIMEMPAGYDTEIGERGIRLSGGQKQRVAIARAILRRAPIIILDEATSSVDTETEAKIQRAIGEMSKTRTIIAIAHRLSTILSADMILVLKDGIVAEQGTHEELMRRGGLYTALYKA